MATTTTYASALLTAIKFMEDNGFDNKEVMDKLQKLYAQKSPKGNKGEKSQARKDNEKFAKTLVDTMREKDADSIRVGWVRDNIEGVNSPAKAVAVLNVAVELGLVTRETVKKSATRSEFVYHLAN